MKRITRSRKPKALEQYITEYRNTDKSSFRIDKAVAEKLLKEAKTVSKKAQMIIIMGDLTLKVEIEKLPKGGDEQ
jgi:uncharacterized membrane protein